MRYIGGVVTLAALVFPMIILYKLWSTRKDSNINNGKNINQQDPSSSVVTSYVMFDSEDSRNNVDDNIIREPAESSSSMFDYEDSNDNIHIAIAQQPLLTTSPSTLPATSHSKSSNSSGNNNITQQLESTSDLATPSAMSHPADSSYSTSLPSVEYEVFLSFRGPDTRYQITEILFRFLIHSKIHTFKDDDEMRKGEGIWPALVKAINQSKVYVPILSENYAHSKWCLNELAEIIECCKQDKRRIILPIFYMVDPRDVRHQSGPYEEAFKKHEEMFGPSATKTWRNALKDIGTLKGWHVKNNNEQGAIADEVSSVIWSHLSKDNFTLYTDELVGIDDHVEAVVEKLNLHVNNVTMVGIHGIGGIGKTTIAKAIYNKISSSFDRCCFIEDIRATQEHKDGIVVLQKKLIYEILKTDKVCFNGDSEGRKIIRERVARFKILVILDDVDEKFKFEEIFGSPTDFQIGSRFIGTSRNIKVLSALNDYECKLYEVGTMSQSRALELFCKHAFKKSSPPPGYKNITNNIVSTAGGLPLTLKVIGTLLFREEMAVWEDKLKLLRETLEFEVMDRLKISYDTLPSKAQQIFLDIACFFIGRNKEMPCYMWNDCQFYPTTNINILVQRSMIKVGENEEFLMHDQLRDMGKEIVRQEDIEHPWMTSRICYDNRDSPPELLIEKKGTDRVKALRVISSHRLKAGEFSYLSDDDPRKEFESECFLGLSGLRYLDADYTSLTGDFSNLLQNLRWLELHNHEDGSHPMTNFQMRNLIILDLHNSTITDDWGGWTYIQMANKLKVLDLHGCSRLRTLPLFPQSGSLEILHLSLFESGNRYMNWSMVLDIDKLKKLKLLSLSGRTMEMIIGGTFGMMKELEELNITNFYCNNLREVVVDIGDLSLLKILRMQGAKVMKTRSSGEKLMAGIKLPHTSLKILKTSFPIPNLAEMLELEELSVDRCNRGLDIPPADICDQVVNVWWKVSKLKKMNLSKTVLNGGSNTSQYFLLPSSLLTLYVKFCPDLVWLPNLDNLENLTRLYISMCHRLKEIQLGHGRLRSLEDLEIRYSSGLTRIQGLKHLMFSSNCKLHKLKLENCAHLNWDRPLDCDDDQTVGVATSESLEDLCIRKCPQLDVGPVFESCMFKLPRVRRLEVGDALLGSQEMELSGIGCMEQLEELELYKLPMEKIASLSKLQKLRSIEIRDVPNLRDIAGLGDLKSLEMLSLRICPQLDVGPMFESCGLNLPSLKKLVVGNAMLGSKEMELSGIGCMEQLEELKLYKLPMERIASLSKLQKLRSIDIKNVLNLKEIAGLGDLKSLERLVLKKCPSLEQLWSADHHLPKLKVLMISMAGRLQEIAGLGDLPSLTELSLDKCSSLERLWPADQQQLNGLKKMSSLSISECEKVMDAHKLSDLEKSLPNAKISYGGLNFAWLLTPIWDSD